MGFEPTNGGFADLSLGPLGYRAELLSIAKLAQTPGVAASDQNCVCLKFKLYKHFARRQLKQVAEATRDLERGQAELFRAYYFLFVISYLPRASRFLLRAGTAPILPAASG